MRCDARGDHGIVIVRAADAFLRAHRDELVPSAREGRQLVACRIGRRRPAQRQAAAELGQHPRIDRIGFRAPASSTREVARLLGIDAGMRDAGRGERTAQYGIVATGGLEHDQTVAPA